MALTRGSGGSSPSSSGPSGGGSPGSGVRQTDSGGGTPITDGILGGGVGGVLGGRRPEPEPEDQGPMAWTPERRTFGSFIGEDTQLPGGMLRPDQQETTGGATPAQELIGMWYDDEEREQILNYMRERGIDVTNLDDAERIWRESVERSVEAYGSGHEKSPWDIMDLYAPSITEEQDGGAGAQGPEPVKGMRFQQTRTNRSIDELDSGEVKQTITKSLREMIGRAPTEEEIEDFSSRANALAAENPSVQETTTTQEWDEDLERYVETERETETSGGVSGSMLAGEAQEQAMESDEYGAYQASTTYYNALMDLLAGA